MDEPLPPKYRAPREWVLWGGAASLLAAVAAFAYAVIEHELAGQITDAPLIVLITLNTLIIYRLGCSISKDLGRLFFYMPKAGQDPQGTVDDLLGSPRILLGAILFASFAATAVWNVDPWQSAEQPEQMRLWLCVFLFCNNLIVGAVLVAIVRFWHVLLRELEEIEISILNLASPFLCALLKVNSRLVMGTALVASLAVCSIPLSDYTMNPVTKVFSGFSLLLVIATYAVPILPLSNLLATRKAEALHRLEKQIDAHVRHRSKLPPKPGMPAAVKDLTPLKDLIEARDLVSHVRTLPPGGQFSVSAAAIITFLSFLPTLIDLALDRLS
ncbi:MAG: hypothetical protein AB8B58_07635 [Roseobacter sp.]